MNIYTLKDLDKIAKEQGYKFASLVDSRGDILVPFNHNTEALIKRFTEIKKRLNAPALADGYYIVKFKNKQAKKASTDNYMVAKGNPADLLVPDEGQFLSAPEGAKETPDVLSYSQAIENNREIVELQAEVNRLGAELDRANETIEELEQEAEQVELSEENKPGSMEASAKTYISSLADMLQPVANTYFELEDRKLKLQEAKFVQQVQPQQQQQIEPQQEEYSPELQRAYWQQLAELAKENPEEYFKVMQDMGVQFEPQQQEAE